LVVIHGHRLSKRWFKLSLGRSVGDRWRPLTTVDRIARRVLNMRLK